MRIRPVKSPACRERQIPQRCTIGVFDHHLHMVEQADHSSDANAMFLRSLGWLGSQVNDEVVTSASLAQSQLLRRTVMQHKTRVGQEAAFREAAFYLFQGQSFDQAPGWYRQKPVLNRALREQISKVDQSGAELPQPFRFDSS